MTCSPRPPQRRWRENSENYAAANCQSHCTGRIGPRLLSRLGETVKLLAACLGTSASSPPRSGRTPPHCCSRTPCTRASTAACSRRTRRVRAPFHRASRGAPGAAAMMGRCAGVPSSSKVCCAVYEFVFLSRRWRGPNVGRHPAGGIEWNWSPGFIGHTVFTESAVHLARVTTECVSPLRLWHACMSAFRSPERRALFAVA